MGICALHPLQVFYYPYFFLSLSQNPHPPKKHPRKFRKIYRLDQKKLEFSIQMSNYTSNSCTYYSSINSLHEDLSKKLRSNSLVTSKGSFPKNNNWVSIMNSLNEGTRETEIMIDDLNFKKSNQLIIF